MTRINLITPILLTDQHLFAECREINHIYSYVERHYKRSKLKLISPTYTLNKGHVMFFMNKLKFIYTRHLDLIETLRLRNTHPNYAGLSQEFLNALQQRYIALPDELKNNYVPTKPEILINLERIAERINAKPAWYRMLGKSIEDMKYPEFLTDIYEGFQ